MSQTLVRAVKDLGKVCKWKRGGFLPKKKHFFRWYKGKCQKYASKGESCTESDLICLDPATPLSLTCSKSGICECSDGYYDRGHDCRLKSHANEGKK